MMIKYSHSNLLVTGAGYRETAEEVRSDSQPWKTTHPDRAPDVCCYWGKSSIFYWYILTRPYDSKSHDCGRLQLQANRNCTGCKLVRHYWLYIVIFAGPNLSNELTTPVLIKSDIGCSLYYST